MALVVDSNILLYAANRGCPEYESCLDFLRGLVSAGDTCFVPENVIYEFLRVATHPRVFPQPLRASESVNFESAPPFSIVAFVRAALSMRRTPSLVAFFSRIAVFNSESTRSDRFT